MQNKTIKIAVYYDGSYFLHISNYYNYDHPKRKRLSISGLHQFIRYQLALEENTSYRYCQIVDAHYFRSRLSAQEAYQRGSVLYWDRVFDDILMSAGIVTHYLPQKQSSSRKEDRGVDVWLALEAYEQAFLKKIDVVVLIAGDGDYLPLIRKLNTLGTKVMLLSWELEFTTEHGKAMTTRTPRELLDEVTYPLAMHELIDGRRSKNDPIINDLFVPGESKQRSFQPSENGDIGEQYEDGDLPPPVIGEVLSGEVLSLKNGYGFIRYPPNNLFFHHSSVQDMDFHDLLVGDLVEYTLERNEDGQLIATNVRLIEEEEE